MSEAVHIGNVVRWNTSCSGFRDVLFMHKSFQTYYHNVTRGWLGKRGGLLGGGPIGPTERRPIGDVYQFLSIAVQSTAVLNTYMTYVGKPLMCSSMTSEMSLHAKESVADICYLQG